MLALPTSIAPPATAADTAVPLLRRSIRAVKPASRTNPLIGVEHRRYVVVGRRCKMHLDRRSSIVGDTPRGNAMAAPATAIPRSTRTRPRGYMSLPIRVRILRYPPAPSLGDAMLTQAQNKLLTENDPRHGWRRLHAPLLAAGGALGRARPRHADARARDE